MDILYTSNHNNIPFGLGNMDFDKVHTQHQDLSGIQSSRLLMNTKFAENQRITTSRDNFFLGKSKITMYNNYHKPNNMSMRQNHIVYDRNQNLMNHSKNNSHNISELQCFDMFKNEKSNLKSVINK
jgi:hypothetical protein